MITRFVHKKGFSLVEVTVVLVLVVVVLGAAFYKYRGERTRQMVTASRVDKTRAMRRFLLFFRQDMQSMSKLTRFRVFNSSIPQENSRVIEVIFERFVDEFDKESITYRYDYNGRRLYRLVDDMSGEEARKGRDIENVANFQLIPFDFDGNRIRNPANLKNLFFFEAHILFAQAPNSQHPMAPHPLKMSIYPKLKSTANKAGFNQFMLNDRFQ